MAATTVVIGRVAPRSQPAARGEDAYWLGMMQSTSEVM